MTITLASDDTEVTAVLVEGDATRDFLALLPLELTLSDYRETEKVSDLPRRLSTAGAPEGHDPEVGDITYYAPWGNLAIFYEDFEYSQGLVKLGRLESGVEVLAE
ncbi:MAG: cyclophilin-like fold protein [Actinomycetota bacterium]|nr:cyclophilin-like fold protein [Actinomycetota bacterium]